MTSITKEVEDLETTIAGLMMSVTAIQTSIGGLETNIGDIGTNIGDLETAIENLDTDYTAELADLAAGLEEANTAIASLTIALGNVLTEADLATISSTLANVQADVKELLNSNTVVNQSISITNRAQLLLAESLIGTETSDPLVIVNGFVRVTINASNFTAAEIIRVNAITTKIATVLQYVEASSTVSPIDFSNLSFVDGYYTVTGIDANDPMLATLSGDLTIAHTGAADYSQITSIGGNVVIDPSVSSVNLSGATITGNVSTDGSGAGVIVLPSATSVHIGTAEVNTASLTLAEGVVNLGYEGVIGNVLIEAPKAGSIEFAAKTVTGTLMVSANVGTTIWNAPNLTTASATTITAEAANFPKLTEFTGDSVITADTVTFPELTGNASGTLDFPTADNFVAPKLTITSNVSATTAENVEFLSGSSMNLSAPAAKTISILKLGNTTNFDASGYAALETLNVTGSINASPTAINVTSVVSATGATIKNATIAGMIDTVNAGTAVLASFSTSGYIRSLNLSNATVLESATIGHDHIAGSGEALLVFDNNAKLASVDLSSVSDVGTIQITNNALLTAFTAPATSPLTETVATITATVTNNKLEATYTPGTAIVSATATTPEIPAVNGSFVQASVYGLRLWLEAHYSHVASPTFNIEIDAVDSDADGMFDDGDYATVSNADANNTSKDGINQIDIPAELSTVKKE